MEEEESMERATPALGGPCGGPSAFTRDSRNSSAGAPQSPAYLYHVISQLPQRPPPGLLPAL